MSEQESTQDSLGQYRRAEREKRGVTVEQIVSATKISLRLVHALEADQFVELPAKPFIRGFVISYCRFLGVPHQDVLTRYARFLDERSEQRPKRDAGHSGYAFDRREGEGGRKALAITMGVMLVVAGIVVAVFKPTLKHHRKSHIQKLQTETTPAPTLTPATQVAAASPESVPAPTSSPSPVTAVVPTAVPTPVVAAVPSRAISPTPVVTPVPVESPAASPSVERRPDPMNSGKDYLKDEIRLKVVIRAQEDLWVKFKVDAKDRNKIILRSGMVLVLQARDAVSLQTSNPSATQVTRWVGEPGKLQSREGAEELEAVLRRSKASGSDGTTFLLGYGAAGEIPNPFQGEARMVPPPQRAQRGESTAPPETP